MYQWMKLKVKGISKPSIKFQLNIQNLTELIKYQTVRLNVTGQLLLLVLTWTHKGTLYGFAVILHWLTKAVRFTI